jgi:hypothetical protein
MIRREKGLGCAQNPQRQVHALLARFIYSKSLPVYLLDLYLGESILSKIGDFRSNAVKNSPNIIVFQGISAIRRESS